MKNKKSQYKINIIQIEIKIKNKKKVKMFYKNQF